jgi:hypothetical protein
MAAKPKEQVQQVKGEETSLMAMRIRQRYSLSLLVVVCVFLAPAFLGTNSCG